MSTRAYITTKIFKINALDLLTLDLFLAHRSAAPIGLLTCESVPLN